MFLKLCIVKISRKIRYLITLSLAVSLLTLFSGCYTIGPNAAFDSPSPNVAFDSPYYPLDALPEGSILHVPTGTIISEEQLMAYLSGSRVVYVGEAHDNLEHHRVQLSVIKAMEERYPGAVSVGMEMLRRPSQSTLDKWSRGELDDRVFFKEWTKNWGIDYDYYRDILEYIRDRNIPLIALNASREQMLKLSHKGKAGMDELSNLSLPEMDNSDPYHRAMVEAIYYDPSHGKGEFDSFYQMQLLWEETMAETVADYLKGQSEDHRIIVLTGNGHINYGYGLPKRVFRRLKGAYTTILPISPEIMRDKDAARQKGIKLLDVDLPDAPLYIADFVWATRYERLDKRRPMLGVMLREEDGKVEIVSVLTKSVAEKGDIREGDIVESFDGESIKKVSDLQYFVRLKKFGEQAVVTVSRGKDILDIRVEFEDPDEAND